MPDDQRLLMTRCLELARRGQGSVEPNPMVGCVVVRDGQVVGEGWHRAYGQDHAEVEALRAAGDRAKGATMVVSLEPCSHHGNTPPCAPMVVAAGIRRVVIAMQDPFPLVEGGGIKLLRGAGLEVEVGLLEQQARQLNAPYLKLVGRSRPWLIAKWAMTLDGKIATRTGHSRWISGEASREVVHRLRGRMDAVLIGSGTALADDPLLTARPPGPRVAARVIVDSQALLPPDSRLARTAREYETLVFVGPDAPVENCRPLAEAGCEVFATTGRTHEERLVEVLDELADRRMTNVLVEGGSGLLGVLRDRGDLDEVHVFVAPKIIGGAAAKSPLAGRGVADLSQALQLESPIVEQLGDDVYVHGRLRTATP